MELTIRNIGKVREAAVKLDGITVIAGENDTGKSTVGKALFAVFNSFYDAEQRIADSREASVRQALVYLVRMATGRPPVHFNFASAVQYVIEAYPAQGYDGVQLEERLIEVWGEKILLGKIDPQTLDKTAERINQALALRDDEILQSLTERQLREEFNDQITNIFTDVPGEILLNVQKQPVHIWVSENCVEKMEGRLDLHTEAILIDDPFVLDRFNSVMLSKESVENHKDHLRRKMRVKRKTANIVDEILTERRFENLYHMLSSVCAGEITTDELGGAGYRLPGSDKKLDLKNLSTGLKTFVLIKQLLMNSAIEENGTIILDEPEIHLHPEWQLVFAELVVLLHREFGIHILLTTHSPYFLNAIEVYVAKHGVEDKCHYYLAHEMRFDEVTNHLEEIYSQLARPLQDLENQRYHDD